MTTSTEKKQMKILCTRKVGAPAGPRQADNRRAALIKAAEKLFVEKGVEATTMNDIAQVAGFAKGTLYHYFKNKAELLQVLREKFEEEVMVSIRALDAACQPDDWHGRIRAWIEGASKTYFEMNALHDVVIYGTNLPFRYAMADAQITKYLAEIVREGNQSGAWQVDDAQWSAVIMFYSFRGGCDEAIMGAQRPEDIPRKLYEVFMGILGVCL
ncbi:TetR/AcrR family transcriptional regulator [Desulfobulbus rhabdoformis]|uniref:TetR/AcrR family transcriptional regulator n=1 Tax=Desulfobulbus rhabdoformis TaxID=34032 RepID=UPI0019652453|nr:TetR/AcrR family transcriptional regulator [Desulfobulbus rhabdoformis]MBM9616587.1 TetR/AcrR family transcriptional regulator [Desulfobulbus rhabdoformis]